MSTNETNVEMAKHVVVGALDAHFSAWSGHNTAAARSVVAALDAAGLLVSPLHARALAAAEALAGVWFNSFLITEDAPAEAARACRVVGLESLASKKPKERWTAVGAANATSYYVTADEGKGPIMCGLTAPQARAVAQALNNLEPTS